MLTTELNRALEWTLASRRHNYMMAILVRETFILETGQIHVYEMFVTVFWDGPVLGSAGRSSAGRWWRCGADSPFQWWLAAALSPRGSARTAAPPSPALTRRGNPGVVRSPREGPAGRNTDSGTAHMGEEQRRECEREWGGGEVGSLWKKDNQPHKGRGLAWNPSLTNAS